MRRMLSKKSCFVEANMGMKLTIRETFSTVKSLMMGTFLTEEPIMIETFLEMEL
jgi:hypothetical protein